jgi:hypothetical protein
MIVLIQFGFIQTNAQTTTWTGITSSNWNVASNWDNGIPTATYNVIVNTAPFNPQINSTVSIQSLTLQTGANLGLVTGSLTVSTNSINQGTVVLNGANWINQGDLQNSGTIQIGINRTLRLSTNLINNGVISGANPSVLELNSTGIQTVSGTGTANLNQLVKAQGQLNLEQDINVGQTLNIPALLTLNLGVGRNLSLNQNLAVLGTLNAASATLTFQGITTQNLTSNSTLNILQLTLNKTAGIVNLDANLNLTQDLTVPTGVQAVLFANRTLGLDNQLIINGTFTNTATNTTINFRGTSAINLGTTSLANFQNLQISKTGAGNLSIEQNTTINGNLLINTGTLNQTTSTTLNLAGNFTNNGNDFIASVGSTINLTGTNNQTIGGTSLIQINQLQISKITGIVSITNSLVEIEENLTIPASVTLEISAGQNLNLSKNLNITGTLNAANATLTLQDINNQTIQGNGAVNLLQLILNKTTGIVDIDANISLTQNFTIPLGVGVVLFANRTLSLGNQIINNGTFTNIAANTTINFMGTSAITLGGSMVAFQNLQISKTNPGNLILAQNTTVNGNLLINSGTFNVSAGFTINLAGNFTNNGNNFIANTGSIINLIGNNNQTLGGTAQVQFDQLQVSKTAGTLFIARNPIEVIQDFTIPVGVSLRVNPGQNFDVYNDFINEGIVLPNDGGLRFRGTGTSELRGAGTMTFRDVFTMKTGAGNNVIITVPINVASWVIINAGSQLSLDADITAGSAGSIARMQNNGVFIDNGFKLIVGGGGNYNIQGNTETVFSNIEIIKTTGSLVFQQSATILQNFILPTNITLTVNANLNLRLQGNLTVNGIIDPSQTNSTIWFTGTTSTQINGTANPATFNNIRLAKTGGNTLNLNINTQYANQIYVEANNTFRLNDGLTTLVQNNSNTFIYGILSLGNNTAMNYGNGNAELRLESGGRFTNDISSNNRIAARIRVRSGSVFTVSNGSTLTSTGVFFNVEGGTSTLTLNPNATLIIYRDLQLNNNSVLNFDNTSFIEFAGNQNSDIEGGGNQLTIPNLRINKLGDAVDLLRRVLITYRLDLVSRNINSTDVNLLIFAEGAIYSGGSTVSYINGPARKIGNTSFVFPLGNNNRFGRLGITVNTAGAATDYFDAEYFGIFFGNTSITAPLTDVSDRDFWQLERIGTTQVKVMLHWQDDISGGLGPNAVNRADLQVAQWNDISMSWESRGNTTTTITDFVESNANQNDFAANKFWSLTYRNGDNTNWGASTWIGSMSTDWDNPNNWEPAVVPDATITAVIIGDRLLGGNFNPIKNSGGSAIAKALLIPRIIFPTGLPTTQKGFLTIASGFTLQVGDATAGSGQVDCYGDILNQGTITNTQDFYLYEDAVINNGGSVLVGRQLRLYNTSVINNINLALIRVSNNLYAYNNIQINNQGTIETGQNIELRNNSIINNQNNGNITVGQVLELRDASVLTNDNLLNTNRQLNVFNDAILNNNALINTGLNPAQPGTFTMNNNSRLNNNTGASINIDAGSSFFLNNSVTINNGGTLTSGRQVELRDTGVTLTNNGLIKWQQDFINNGTFTGTGTIEVYANNTNSRIYGSATPFITHNFIISRTGGVITQERSCVWTNSVTVPANITLEIQTGLLSNQIQGNFTVNGTFNLQGDAALAISGNFINNNTVIAGVGSTVAMQGGANASIQGTNPLTLHHLINQKTAGNTQINANITLNGNLSNLSTSLEMLATSSINLRGNLINNAGFVGNTGSSFTFSGNTNSDISGTQVASFARLSMGKNTGNQLTLSQSAEVSESLTLTTGLINTTSTELLILRENATSTEGNPQSYINGSIRKYVNSNNFIFPTGKNGRWARIAITDLASTTSGDYFTANYIPFRHPDNTVVGLAHRSGIEYWVLDRSPAATTEAKVTLYWEDNVFSDITDISITDLRVAHYTTTPSTAWYDRGGVITGTLAQGQITTDTRQNSFSPWTFGSKNGVNPLPIRLISFTAEVTSNQQVTLLKWTTASEENVSHFEIERSQDGLNFQTILSKDAAGNSIEIRNYQIIDNQPYNGINYYRLKSVDLDGSITYSLIETVRFEEETFAIQNLYPNPVVSEVNIDFTLTKNTPYRILIYDLQGRQVYLSEIQTSEKIQVQTRLNLSQLTTGTYILKIISNQKSITRRLVKIDN